ncbi:hypothetical protein KEM52_003814, partial [Ascosphaera acerosa]
MGAETVVIMQDQCYSHRFSRYHAAKAEVESIVERPERLQACALGVAAAYVLLGERSSAGRYAPEEFFDVARFLDPPFEIRKSTASVSLTAPAVTHVHGSHWMHDLKLMCETSGSRLASAANEVERPLSSVHGLSHGHSGTAPSTEALHAGDLYLCPESRAAFEGALGGVCEAVDAVFTGKRSRRAFVMVRPPGHHCSADQPSGFCWVNNVHVGITHAAMEYGLTHAAIIDFDLHHGDGSQALAWQQNARAARLPKSAAPQDKARIGYFSLHDIESFPCENGDAGKIRDASVCIENAHGQFIHNVHMAPWHTDE